MADNSKVVISNRSKLMNMIALSEDITRTNNRIHDLLENMMNNPGNKHNLYKSIEDLLHKVNNLQNVKIGSEFITTEDVIVPKMEDASPKKDIGLEPILKNTEITREEEEHNEVLEEATKTPQPPRRTGKRGKRQRPPRNVKRDVKKPLRDLQDKTEDIQED